MAKPTKKVKGHRGCWSVASTHVIRRVFEDRAVRRDRKCPVIEDAPAITTGDILRHSAASECGGPRARVENAAAVLDSRVARHRGDVARPCGPARIQRR